MKEKHILFENKESLVYISDNENIVFCEKREFWNSITPVLFFDKKTMKEIVSILQKELETEQ